MRGFGTKGFSALFASAFLALGGSPVFAADEPEFFGLVEQDVPVSQLDHRVVESAYKRGGLWTEYGVLKPVHQHESTEVRTSFTTKILHWKSVGEEQFKVRLKRLAHSRYEVDPKGYFLKDFFSEVRRKGLGYVHRSQIHTVPSDLKAIPITE